LKNESSRNKGAEAQISLYLSPSACQKTRRTGSFQKNGGDSACGRVPL